LRLVFEPGNLGDGDAVVLGVIGEECERAVGVDNVGAEHCLVPVQHRVEARRAAYDVRQLRRCDAPAARRKLGVALVLAHIRPSSALQLFTTPQ
jgi:hypothetical protein